MIPERLQALRAEMTKRGIDIYLVPTADFHESQRSHTGSGIIAYPDKSDLIFHQSAVHPFVCLSPCNGPEEAPLL